MVEKLWWNKFVSDHVSFTLSVIALPILHIYIHLLPTLYVLDQECPTGGKICKFILVGGARECDDFHIVVLINYV